MSKQAEKLVIDGQVFQTAAWHRGMGKYSFSLLNALFDKGITDTYKSVDLVLNKNLTAMPESIEAIKNTFTSVNLKYVDLVTQVPAREQAATRSWTRDRREAI